MRKIAIVVTMLTLASTVRAQISDDVVAQQAATINLLQSELAKAREAVQRRDEQIKMLEDELQTLRTRLAILEGGGSANPASPGGSTSSPKGSVSVEELERQLKAVRSQIGLANAEITRAARGTVDAKNVQPPGGMTIPPGGSYNTGSTMYYGGADGLLLRKQVSGSVTHEEGIRRWTEQQYHYVPCGPAITRGTFRTVGEKDAAINKAKTVLLPLRIKERELLAALETAKKDAKEPASREEGDKKGTSEGCDVEQDAKALELRKENQ